MKTLMIMITLALASGCSNLDYAKQVCLEMGWKPGTMPYGTCVRTREARANANDAAAMGAWAASQQMYQYRAPINCYHIGNLTQCY